MNDVSTAENWFLHTKRYLDPDFRLFCFPYAGGGAAFFSSWSKKVPSGVEIWPIQYPGHQTRLSEQPFRRLTEMVEALTSAIEAYIDVPYAFFGHSMGALICFELARQLRRLHLPLPLHLFLSGRCAPQLENRGTGLYHLEDALFLEAIHQLDYFSSTWLENKEIWQFMLPPLRADFELVETYRYNYELPLDCALSVFGGTEDFSISPAQLQAWSKQTSGPFHFSLFPGDHFFLHANQTSLLRIINSRIAQIALSQVSNMSHVQVQALLEQKVLNQDKESIYE